jgi:CPA1 family monovalent cation:H+ antiporter
MVVSLLLSLALLGLDALGFGDLRAFEAGTLRSIDFSSLLLDGLLSVLLFAGALQVDISRLRAYRWQVAVLAVGGTAVSTLVVGFGVFVALPWVGLSLPLAHCLVFGALISPTDPIAVISILRSTGIGAEVESVLAGESLFNDGVGVVLFAVLAAVATHDVAPQAHEVLFTLGREAGGGVLLGGVLGGAMFVLLRSINNYKVEVLITLAGVLGGYELAHQVHVSGPLAMVVAGVIIGNHGRALAMSDTTRHHVDLFWELLDDILNALLFVLIGLEIVVIEFPDHIVGGAALAIGIALLARLLAVGAPVALFGRWFRLPAGAWKILTWGGLRGGISVALALSLRAGPEREVILALTYAVVVFSILVQGLTIRRVAATQARGDA